MKGPQAPAGFDRKGRLVTRWVVRGYYLEDWPEPGDESEGVVALVIADTEEEARAEYERHYQNCSSVLLDAEDEWNEHRRQDAATAEHFGKVHVAPSSRERLQHEI
jgi:hypothetical protein